MSLDAINWVAKQKAGNATAKHVLLWLAFHSNGKSGKCFPSLDTLAEEMEVGSKNTIRAALKTLLDRKLISCEREMKGARVARTFYRLNFDGSNSDTSNIEGSKIDISNIEHDGSNSEPYGSNIELSMVQKLTPNKEIEQGINRERNKEVMCAPAGAPQPPEMSDDEIADLLESVPQEKGERPPFEKGAHLSEKGDHPSEKDAHLSSGDKKPARKKPATTAFCAVPRPDDVDPQVWSDWMAVRKRKNKPLTETAFNFLKSQAEKAGISTARAIELCAQNGWLGFREEYLRNSFSRNSNSYQPAMKTPIKRKRAEDYVWKVK